MNPFHHSLLSSVSGFSDISDLTLKITSGQETVLPSISWFNAFESAKHPAVVCDKKYFFLYSTDHDASDAGAIMWGKGDNIDLSDFVEIAEIFSGFQIETPQLLTVPSEVCGDSEVLHLFAHTEKQEPGNDNKQQTRLFTSAGGTELHNMSWTDRNRPLGIVEDENHTGYLFPYELELGNYIGTHIGRGLLPQPWKNSISNNPRTWIRNETLDVISGVENGFFAQLSEGRYFELFNQIWWLGQIHPEVGSIFSDDRKLILAKADKIAGEVSQVLILNEGSTNIRHSVFVKNNEAHIYITNPVTKMYYATYDLTNLKNYL